MQLKYSTEMVGCVTGVFRNDNFFFLNTNNSAIHISVSKNQTDMYYVLLKNTNTLTVKSNRSIGT